MDNQFLRTLRSIPSEEHRQALIDFHDRMSLASGDGPSFAARFAEDMSKFLGKKFTAEEVMSLYVIFLKNAIYMIVCQALPVFLQVIKDKDYKFLQEFAKYLTIITPDQLPKAELEARN